MDPADYRLVWVDVDVYLGGMNDVEHNECGQELLPGYYGKLIESQPSIKTSSILTAQKEITNR